MSASHLSFAYIVENRKPPDCCIRRWWKSWFILLLYFVWHVCRDVDRIRWHDSPQSIIFLRFDWRLDQTTMTARILVPSSSPHFALYRPLLPSFATNLQAIRHLVSFLASLCQSSCFSSFPSSCSFCYCFYSCARSCSSTLFPADKHSFPSIVCKSELCSWHFFIFLDKN